MKTFTTKCPLTGVEKSFDVISEEFCVNNFKNGAGKTSVTLFRIEGEKVNKVCTFAERHANDISEIKDDLKFNGVKSDISTDINDYLVSKIS